jgi:SpoVK/Ycf46/Vps4 family AAA+-type ATPase
MSQNPNPSGLQWMVRGSMFQMCGRTLPRLPAGAYTCGVNYDGQVFFNARHLQTDDIIDFTDSLASRALDEIGRFWKLGDRFKRHGFLHRRGYLFYGKQGCGKSSLVHLIVSRIIAAGHLAFFCEQPSGFVGAMEQLRQVEPDRPMVCVFEDIDAVIKTYGDSDLLQWLDGNHQVDRAINLATTNYPEQLDRRIISRPRRFDRILRIDAPDARLREAYYRKKLPELSESELNRWVELSDGLPFAALAELIISVCCLGNDLERSAALMRDLDSHSPSSAEFQQEAEADEAEETPVPALAGPHGDNPF